VLYAVELAGYDATTIVELSHDRLIELVALEGSCLLNRNVMPAVRWVN
jgi:hypothetical protein